MDDPQDDPATPSDLGLWLRILTRASQLKPRGLVQTSSGKRAPFQEWLGCLEAPAHAQGPRGSEPTLSELRRRCR